MSGVRLEAVSKAYGETHAVHELNLEVADGEFVTLLGPSGCGKTTTLRMIAGLIPPTAGHIFFDDDEVTYLPARARNVGFVFQTPALFPHLSVADNVAFGLSVKGVKKTAIKPRVDELLQLVDLAGYGKRLPAQLSGGQQQRIALARVLATDPRVLLFDEPLSALDKNLRDRLKLSIRELQRRTGKTAIYVTHDQSEAFAISDRIVVMNAGRAEQIGTQTDIYLNPQTKFVAEFIGANNAVSGTVEAFEGSGDGARIVATGDGLRLRCPMRNDVSQGDRVLLYLRPEDLVVVAEDDDRGYENVIDGVIDRVIFEGATVQLWVDVGGRELRADVTGGQRLSLTKRHGRVRLGVTDITVIPTPRLAVGAEDEAQEGLAPSGLSAPY
jgi:ABC-type Fe3+/spermidine/putrescine transport system ATPase subunit